MTGRVNVVSARFDCHVHSRRSPDGTGTLKQIAAVIREKGLQGFCATDHNVMPDMQELRAAAGPDLLIIPGIEVSTKDGHCLALGIQGDVRPGLPLIETIENISAVGGIAVPSHPFRMRHGIGPSVLNKAKDKLLAIEVFNARDGNGFRSSRAWKWAETHDKGGTGGSDAHGILEAGNAFVEFPTPPTGVDDFVAELQRRSTWGAGEGTDRFTVMAQEARTFGLWVKRGFKPI